ncbi:Uncharacterised protein [Mycolicibacterium gilvum]|uniref:Transmembrane protein n=1 Tax=Mycolicibacterium gilvum TaxID=1804 RepID=A0A378SSG4_9MYCO|nr:Uncharacterised protein [Mycolicibacterium gilvum]
MSYNRCRGWRCHPLSVAPRTAKKTDSRLAARLAALASLGAAVIHFAVVPTHWQEWMPAGVFFTSIAAFQLLWARLVLTRTTTPVLAAGIMLNLGAIALWAVSRTAGAPYGPHAGQAEVVQAADLCALLLQIYVVMGAGWVWYRGLQGEPVPVFGSTLVLMGAVGVVALASTVGAASGLRHGHHAPAGADGGHHGTTAEGAHSHHGPTDAEPDHHGQSIEQVEDHHRHEEPTNSPPTESIGTPPAPAPTQSPPAPAMPLHDTHADHDHDE